MLYIVTEFAKNGEMFGKPRLFWSLVETDLGTWPQPPLQPLGLPLPSSCGALSPRPRGRPASGCRALALGCHSSDYLTSNGHLSENEARKKFWQILSAVEYCHSHHIVHRDLKTENLLLDGSMDIKLAGKGAQARPPRGGGEGCPPPRAPGPLAHTAAEPGP